MISRPAAAVVLGAAAAALAACAGRRTPPPAPKPSAAKLDPLSTADPTALRPYLDAFPLGSLGARIDLLAADDRRSMHLVQAKRAIARHSRPGRAETMYVLSGTGVCYVGEKSYPVAPGSTFHVAPGVVHSITVDPDSTLVAVVYLEPPLLDGDDRAPAR